MSSMTRTAFSALRWNYAGFFARSGSNFIIGILLARLLGPKPFGQIAAAMVYFRTYPDS
jgi:O-antigen/teichoic acid export membrane protein